MALDIHELIVLELAALERKVLAAVRERMAAEQLGEAWEGIENA